MKKSEKLRWIAWTPITLVVGVGLSISVLSVPVVGIPIFIAFFIVSWLCYWNCKADDLEREGK